MKKTLHKRLNRHIIKADTEAIAADGITWFTYDNEKNKTRSVLISVFFCILHGSLIFRNYHIVVGVVLRCVLLLLRPQANKRPRMHANVFLSGLLDTHARER